MLVVSFVVVVRQSLQEPRGQGGREGGGEGGNFISPMDYLRVCLLMSPQGPLFV